MCVFVWVKNVVVKKDKINRKKNLCGSICLSSIEWTAYFRKRINILGREWIYKKKDNKNEYFVLVLQ